MSRESSGLTGLGPFPASKPSESLLFARAITEKSSPGSAMDDAASEADCEYLEFLAAISPEYERRLRNLAKTPHGDEPRWQQLEWLAEISPEHARQLDDLRREEAIAAEVRERSQRIIERLELERAAEAEWDASKHPRAGGPPNAGWFASTGGSTALAPPPANPSPKPDGLARPPRQQDQLAQAPPPAQPPAQGGQQANPPVNPAARGKFGTWPARPAGFAPEEIRGNGMHPAVQRRLKIAHAALPVLVRGTLRNNGVEVPLDHDDNAVRADHAARGIKVPADAGGLYDAGKGVIHVFEKMALPGGHFRGNGRPEHTLRHEAGHALDHYLSDLSQTPGFIQVYNADRGAAPNIAALDASEQHYLSKPSETFAEAIARIIEKGDPGTLRNSVQYLQEVPRIRELLGLRPLVLPRAGGS